MNLVSRTERFKKSSNKRFLPNQGDVIDEATSSIVQISSPDSQFIAGNG